MTHRRHGAFLKVSFVQFGGRLFRQVIGIPMGTNCAPLLADLFLYSYENEFLDNMIRSGHRRLARSFNLCYRYTDDLIVFNNISQLIRYARCCSHYEDFRYRHKCLVDRFLSQGYIALRLEKSFKKFYGRYQDLIEKYQRSVNVMVNDSFSG